MSEHLDVELDAVTSAYLRRHCTRGDLGATASKALHDLAMRDAGVAIARYERAHEAELLASIEDNEAALAEAS